MSMSPDQQPKSLMANFMDVSVSGGPQEWDAHIARYVETRHDMKKKSARLVDLVTLVTTSITPPGTWQDMARSKVELEAAGRAWVDSQTPFKTLQGANNPFAVTRLIKAVVDESVNHDLLRFRKHLEEVADGVPVNTLLAKSLQSLYHQAFCHEVDQVQGEDDAMKWYYQGVRSDLYFITKGPDTQVKCDMIGAAGIELIVERRRNFSPDQCRALAECIAAVCSPESQPAHLARGMLSTMNLEKPAAEL